MGWLVGGSYVMGRVFFVQVWLGMGLLNCVCMSGDRGPSCWVGGWVHV